MFCRRPNKNPSDADMATCQADQGFAKGVSGTMHYPAAGTRAISRLHMSAMYLLAVNCFWACSGDTLPAQDGGTAAQAGTPAEAGSGAPAAVGSTNSGGAGQG